MSDPNDATTAPETVSCAVCKKEIPSSVAVSPEAHEYTLYFCGADCRAAWEKDRAKEVERAFSERSGVKSN